MIDDLLPPPAGQPLTPPAPGPSPNLPVVRVLPPGTPTPPNTTTLVPKPSRLAAALPWLALLAALALPPIEFFVLERIHGGATPAPGPGPAPPPVPKPAVTTPLFATLFYDSAKQPLATLGMTASLPGDLAALQCGWREMEVGEPEVKSLGFQPAIDSVGTPCLVIQDKTSGKIVPPSPMKSPDAAGIVGVVKKLRGQ